MTAQCLTRLVVLFAAAIAPAAAVRSEAPPPLEIPADVLLDKIHGGLVGQLLGNLNGLPHEFKYIDQPGDVPTYTPALPEGAWTDDDTDIEWVYIVAMESQGRTRLTADEIAQLWRKHINRRIWCANRHARAMMEIGIEPPLTGRALLNPWSDFNISGQFLCESFGLAAPAMPQTAARLGLHYTQVGIEGEPAQTTQLFTVMIATAFTTDRLEEILDAGMAAVDPRSETAEVVSFVRELHRGHPDDWRTARRNLAVRYTRHGGGRRDRNGYELNTAATIAALLYGKGDFAETLRIAFALGWDCDNNAATAGTILGVIRGYEWFRRQGWEIADRYRNTTRDAMPEDETISRFAERICRVARLAIAEQGGEAVKRDGREWLVIRREAPRNVLPLVDPDARREELRARLRPQIDAALAAEADRAARARAAYYALALGLDEELAREQPQAWAAACEALTAACAGAAAEANLVAAMHDARGLPRGQALYQRALAAGVLPLP